MTAATHRCLWSQAQTFAVLRLFLASRTTTLLALLSVALFALLSVALLALLRAMATSSMRICAHGDYVVAHVALSLATPSRRLCNL
jgi:hypothetical protein